MYLDTIFISGIRHILFISDLDECKLGIHECLPTEDCENEIGTYACYDKEVFGENDIDFDKKCPAGFRFDIEKGVCDGE